MNNIFRLKRELIWNLTDTHIEFFCNKRVLTTEISTENDRKVFNFLTLAKVATGILTVYAFDALVQMDY